MSRVGIIVMFALLLVLGGGFLSIPLLVRDPLPVVSPQTPITVHKENGELPMVARIEVDSFGRFVMLFAVPEMHAGGVPRLMLSMPDHDVAPEEVTVEAAGEDRFRAAGTLAMPGRWEALIRQGGAERSFQFILREF